MAKYSFELKKKVVMAYLNGEGGFKYIASVGVRARYSVFLVFANICRSLRLTGSVALCALIVKTKQLPNKVWEEE